MIKTIRIGADVHTELIDTADNFGLKVRTLTEMCISRSCGEFMKNGVTLKAVSDGANNDSRHDNKPEQ